VIRLPIRFVSAIGAGGLIVGLLVAAQPVSASEAPALHVLPIPVDGFHQTDLAWYVRNHQDSRSRASSAMELSSSAGRTRDSRAGSVNICGSAKGSGSNA
jgi:hypothetical protein